MNADLRGLVAKLPSLATLDAVDDAALSGRRPCPLDKFTIADVRLLHTILSVAQEQGFVMVPMPEPNCRERLRVEGKPYPRSSCAVCGKFSPKSSQCDALLAGIAAAAPAQPDGVSK